MWLILLLFGGKRLGQLFVAVLLFVAVMSVLTIVGAFFAPDTAPPLRPQAAITGMAARPQTHNVGHEAALTPLQREVQHFSGEVKGFILSIVSILFFVVLIGVTLLILRQPGQRKTAPGGSATA
jgi:hypothetical protein